MGRLPSCDCLRLCGVLPRARRGGAWSLADPPPRVVAAVGRVAPSAMADVRAALGTRIGAWGLRNDFLEGVHGGLHAAEEAVLAADLTDACVRFGFWLCALGRPKSGAA